MPRRLELERTRTISADRFGQFARGASAWLGSRWGFACAGTAIVAWAVTGPIFHFSDFWQLIVNTLTDIVTFLMVFLIQNTQNRDARAINLKLDELIRAVDTARNHMVNIEKLSDVELDLLEEQLNRVHAAEMRRQARASRESAAD